VACCAAVENIIDQQSPLTPGDVHFSFLPLAHIMERAIEASFLENGAQIGFYRGDLKLIAEDIKVLKPTIFAGVPRFYCKIYDKVMVSVSSSKAKQTLLKAGMWFKGKDVDRGVYSQKTVFDSLVFKRFREIFGGRVRMLVTGASPMPMEVLRFYRIALGCPFFEVYGITECCSAVTCTLINESEPGHVGPPLPCVAVKLVDVPELNYFSKNDEGEICCQGASCFIGYYKNEEKTAETIDKDGWVHTGDIGKWLPNGALKIIDRKKQIFKTQQGEYIAPERVENIYRKSLFVDQVFLHGSTLKPAVVAVIVPDVEYLTQWAASHSISGDPAQLCSNEVIYKVILDDITKAGKESGLKSFEQAKAIHLHPNPFTPSEGLVTATQKLKRNNLQKHFQQEIDNMYGKIQSI
jgi:long-chain acyl-CoA synthetase